MKESIHSLLRKLLAVPGQLLDSLSAAISSPKEAIKYIVLVAILADVYTGGALVSSILSTTGSILGMVQKNLGAVVVALVAYIATRK